MDRGTYKFAPEQWGNIKVDFDNLGKLPRLKIAGTIIHETTHKMVNAVDHCYAWKTSTYRTLSKAQAMDNADSYAFTVISLYKKICIKNEKNMIVLAGQGLDAES